VNDNLIYNVLRGLHILADIAWMAGLLYLPRLYVYHAKALAEGGLGGEMDNTFKIMERRLYRGITTPAMLVAVALGLALIWRDAHVYAGGWLFLLSPWMVVKLSGVVVLLVYHYMLGRALTAFAEGRSTRSERFWRLMNEIPFVAAIVMVLAVTTKFGS